MSARRYLSASDVADELGVSLSTAYDVIHKAGAQPINRCVKVSRANLDASRRANAGSGV